jgi:translocation and assembly module TamB
MAEDLSGQIKFNSEASFSFDSAKLLNANLKMEKLSLKRQDLEFSISDNAKNEIRIESGKIATWDFELNGNAANVKGKGSGDFNGDFQIIQDGVFDAGLIELITDKVAKSSGAVAFRGMFTGKNGKLSHHFETSSNDMSVRMKSAPVSANALSFRLYTDEDKLVLAGLTGEVGNGSVEGFGMARFAFPYPYLNFSLKFDNTRIPLFKKSYLFASGGVRIEGSEAPYRVKGAVNILNGEIEDDLKDLGGGGMGNESFGRYLPTTRDSIAKNYFEYDIGFNVLTPIRLKNSLADVRFGGSGAIVGDAFSPELRGDFSIVPNLSKINFRGHEFALREGRIVFRQGEGKEGPELSFAGSSKISDYDVRLDVAGNVNELVVDFSSNPALGQEDILSLLAIGVTTDVSKGLEEKDRRSITTLGIGSILVDQLKINDGLNSSLGLHFSIQPELEQQEGNLLEGRTSNSDSSTSRFKTSTKIKVQKSVSSKVNLSVSSTVGGEAAQKQEMNLNYNFDRNWSLEGVYELKSSDIEESESLNSVGADIKYRWSF